MARERAGQNGASSQAEANLSVAVVHQLIKLMSSGDIEEITVEEGEGIKLTLRKPAPVAIPVSDDEYDGYFAGEVPLPADAQEPQRREVRSPLVGVFRTSMKPGSKPLVSVGSPVREGQISRRRGARRLQRGRGRAGRHHPRDPRRGRPGCRVRTAALRA